MAAIHHDTASSRPSTESEQEQGLLHGHKKNWEEKEPSFELEGDTRCFAINKWWKLALFLLAWTILVPSGVVWMHKGYSKHGSVSSAPDAPDAPKEPAQVEQEFISEDRYLLDPHWNFDQAPQIREYTWTITEAELNPDGIYRPMLLINDEFPGPLVEVNEHDTLRITVENRASNSTAFHWHGLYQNGSAWMDGTVGITQCPIAPGHTWTYEFRVEGQSGTYWYHAHHSMQASDGLVGPLVIHAKNEKQLQQIGYATDRVVMVSDHYHDASSSLIRSYLAPDKENAEPVPDGALINGRGIRNCDEFADRKCDNSTVNVGNPVFNLAPNQNHRLRIINVGAFAEFQFQIDEHQLTVTEVDGTDVTPRYYHRLNINPAQRYSVVVNTNVSSSDRFWLRARMIPTCFAEPNPHLAADAMGIVRYTASSWTSASDELPKSIDWAEALELECRDMNTTELFPVATMTPPAKPDAFFYLRSNFEIGAHRFSRGFFNTSSWKPSVRSPTLYRAIDGLKDTANTSYLSPAEDVANDWTTFSNGAGSAFVNDRAFHTQDELVIQTTGIQTIDLLIHNFDDGNHPLHLHGYKYFVLAQGHGYPPRTSVFAPTTYDSLSPLYNSLDLSNPLRRDTASVEAFGWILIRFVADNPGAWAFHCHISWHTEAGLLMQFLTRSDGLKGMQVPEAQRAMCDAENVETGMGPMDEDYKDEWR
ncbi:hypothetical protein H2203_003527 [Taxawa tesnikishii (nom. ined.)]|nr:hypothetical protein H2203_003527 [Dothideales sp. JES 119]